MFTSLNKLYIFQRAAYTLNKKSHTLLPSWDMTLIIIFVSPLPTPALSVSGSKGIISAIKHPFYKIYYINDQKANCLIIQAGSSSETTIKIFKRILLLKLQLRKRSAAELAS
jgi:hypothetical protein